jgi:cholesterol transport system auxiliary component
MMPDVRPLMLAVLLATTTGCLLSRAESRTVHTYQLSPDMRASAGEARLADATGPVLLISLPQSDPGFDTQRMVYLTRRYELDYYGVNQWADTPARMLVPLLVQALDRSGAWKAVMPVPASIRGDYRLDTDGLVLQQEFFQQPSRVRLGIRMQLVDLRESRVVGSRTFETVEEASSDDAYGGVLAANRAVAAILDQAASWLQGCLGNARECGR